MSCNDTAPDSTSSSVVAAQFVGNGRIRVAVTVREELLLSGLKGREGSQEKEEVAKSYLEKKDVEFVEESAKEKDTVDIVNVIGEDFGNTGLKAQEELESLQESGFIKGKGVVQNSYQHSVQVESVEDLFPSVVLRSASIAEIMSYSMILADLSSDNDDPTPSRNPTTPSTTPSPARLSPGQCHPGKIRRWESLRRSIKQSSDKITKISRRNSFSVGAGRVRQGQGSRDTHLGVPALRAGSYLYYLAIM